MSDEPILILADPKGKAWNFAKTVYDNLEGRKNRERIYNLGEVDIKRFNDGELFAEPMESVRGRECYLIHDCSMNPQEWIFSLMLLNDAIGGSSAKSLTDVLPYLKYARQDRATEARAPISTSVVAGSIKAFADGLITSDVHNPAVVNAYRVKHFSFENLRAYPVLIEHVKKNLHGFLENAVLEGPDIGAMQLANSWAKRTGLGIISAYKLREKAGIIGDIEIMGDINGRDVILVDDMIDTAGTLCKAAEKSKERGAKRLIACATHGLFSKDAKKRIEDSPLEKVFITDSIPQDNEGKIEIVSISGLIAEAIYRISHNLSISEVYR